MYWLDTASPSFANAYQSAKRAGFSDYSSRVITSNSHNLEWIKEAKAYLDIYTPTHIVSGMQSIATNSKADRDKLRALELLAKIQGMFIERSQSEVSVTFNNSVPRPVIEVQEKPPQEAPKHIEQ